MYVFTKYFQTKIKKYEPRETLKCNSICKKKTFEKKYFIDYFS